MENGKQHRVSLHTSAQDESRCVDQDEPDVPLPPLELLHPNRVLLSALADVKVSRRLYRVQNTPCPESPDRSKQGEGENCDARESAEDAEQEFPPEEEGLTFMGFARLMALVWQVNQQKEELEQAALEFW
ncbi:hypothetical protein CSUI_000441 [Cystoisospora suis]|uniref:Uncharacterized protein n=1 Tax=Cystoisospora suis TaxID=483139 RepID=A0A2C6L0Y6_9APIC|nr:hypothetical protein CSUI_000441 [Cystoisospora suis]